MSDFIPLNIFDSIREGVLVFKTDLSIEYSNLSFNNLFHVDTNALKNKTIHEFFKTQQPTDWSNEVLDSSTKDSNINFVIHVKNEAYTIRVIRIKNFKENELFVMFLNSNKSNLQKKTSSTSLISSESQFNPLDSEDLMFIAALPEMANTSSSAEEFISRSQTRLIRSLGFNQIATWHIPARNELALSGFQTKHRKTKEEIQNWISENKTIVDECMQSELVKYFSSDNSNFILVPHRKRNTLFGISLVEKSNAEMFTDSEIRLVQIYGHQFAVSFENAKLQEGSTHDNLTKLYNAKFFHNRITSELLIADQTESPLSLLLFDIDHFKKFNDTYGHATGDLVLENVAAAVKKVCRGSDIVCRYGGEEFAIILVDTDSLGGKIVAEKIRKAVESLILDPIRPELKVTISVGVATFPNHASNKDTLINCADEAMYDCKKSGRNCSQIYSKKS